jgi:hypothetical protein
MLVRSAQRVHLTIAEVFVIVIKETLEGAEEDEVESFKQALQKRKAENAEQVS